MTLTSTFVAADGDGYELQMGRWSRRLAPQLIAFANITSGARVLDVGCGTGSLTFALAADPAIRSICGIDLAPAYVAHAAERNSDPRVVFQVGDATALPFADALFDHAPVDAGAAVHSGRRRRRTRDAPRHVSRRHGRRRRMGHARRTGLLPDVLRHGGRR